LQQSPLYPGRQVFKPVRAGRALPLSHNPAVQPAGETTESTTFALGDIFLSLFRPKKPCQASKAHNPLQIINIRVAY
jgi:hypothetical protein